MLDCHLCHNFEPFLYISDVIKYYRLRRWFNIVIPRLSNSLSDFFLVINDNNIFLI